MFKSVKCAALAVGVSMAAVSANAGLGNLLKAVIEPDATPQPQQEAAKPNDNACPQCGGNGFVSKGFKAKKCKMCGGTGIVLQQPAAAASAATAATEVEVVFDDVDMDDLKHRKGGILLDVREPGEYAAGHLKGAVNVPVGQVASRMGAVCGDKTRDIYVYCQSGRRSRVAAQTLRGMGYLKVHNALGGVNDWSGKLVK